MRSIQRFVPINSENEKELEKERASLKRSGPTLQPDNFKKQKSVEVESIPDVAPKELVKKEEEEKKPIIKWSRRKQAGRKGVNKSSTKSDVQDILDDNVQAPSSDSFTMDSIAESSTQTAKVVKWKIIKQGSGQSTKS